MHRLDSSLRLCTLSPNTPNFLEHELDVAVTPYSCDFLCFVRTRLGQLGFVASNVQSVAALIHLELFTNQDIGLCRVFTHNVLEFQFNLLATTKTGVSSGLL